MRAGGWSGMRRMIGIGLVAALACGIALGCASREERVAKHLQKASQLENEGHQRAALIELKNALQLEPKNAEVNFQIAEILRRQRRPADALFYYREAQRLDPKRSDAALQEAYLLLGSDPKKAAKLIEDVLAREPQNPLAHVRAADLALTRGDTAKALEAAQTAVVLAPDSAEAHLEVGIVQEARIRKLQLKKEVPPDSLYEAAIQAFSQAVAAKGKGTEPGLRIRAALEQARVYGGWPSHEKEADAAFRAAFDLAQKLQQPPEPVIAAALRYGHRAGAKDLYVWALEQRLKLRPDDVSSWRDLAIAKDPLTAPRSSVLEKLIQERPDDAYAQVTYARDLAARGHRDEAIAHLEKLGDQVDPQAAVLSTLVGLEIQKGDLAAAKRDNDRLQRNFPNTSQAFYADALLARKEGRFDDAAASLQRLVGVKDSAGAQEMLAEVQLARGDTGAALAAVKRALELQRPGEQHPVRLLELQARIEEASGDHQGALRTYARIQRRTHGKIGATDIAPFAKALYGTGRDEGARKVLENGLALSDPPLDAVLVYARYEGKREPEKVAAALDRALAKHPGNASLLRERTAIDVQTGRTRDAEARLRAAIAADPKNGSARVLLVRLLEKEGRNDEALATAREYFEQSPDDPMAPRTLATALIRSGHTQEARQELEARHAKGELKAPGSLVLLARLEMLTGQDDRAIPLLEAALQQNDGMVGAKNDLAYLLAKSGKDLEKALQLAQDARKAAPGLSATGDTLGFVYLKRGLPEAALSQLQNAVDQAEPGSPDYALAEFHRGLALQALNRKDEARQAFEKALAQDFPEAEQARTALQSLGSPKG